MAEREREQFRYVVRSGERDRTARFPGPSWYRANEIPTTVSHRRAPSRCHNTPLPPRTVVTAFDEYRRVADDGHVRARTGSRFFSFQDRTDVRSRLRCNTYITFTTQTRQRSKTKKILFDLSEKLLFTGQRKGFIFDYVYLLMLYFQNKLFHRNTGPHKR